MNAMTEQSQVENPPAYYSDPVSTNALIFQGDKMERIMQLAETMATGRVTVPKHLQNSMGDCLAVTMQAMQWGMNPFAVGQKTHLVNGVLGYEAQLVNAVVQASGAIVGRFHYEYKGEGNDLECRVGAIPRNETDIVWTEWLKSSSVTTKNSPLWKTNPKQQMGYLQVKNWARAYAPGAILGVYTTDELADIPEKEITPAGEIKAAPKSDALPAYTAAQMKDNKPTWEKAIKAGTNTPAGIISKISTKYTLTEDQKREIQNLGAIEGEAEVMAHEADIQAMLDSAEAAAISQSDIKKHLNVESLENLTAAQLEQACQFVANPA